MKGGEELEVGKEEQKVSKSLPLGTSWGMGKVVERWWKAGGKVAESLPDQG